VGEMMVAITEAQAALWKFQTEYGAGSSSNATMMATTTTMNPAALLWLAVAVVATAVLESNDTARDAATEALGRGLNRLKAVVDEIVKPLPLAGPSVAMTTMANGLVAAAVVAAQMSRLTTLEGLLNLTPGGLKRFTQVAIDTIRDTIRALLGRM